MLQTDTYRVAVTGLITSLTRVTQLSHVIIHTDMSKGVIDYNEISKRHDTASCDNGLVELSDVIWLSHVTYDN